ncbi:hypothetical protein NIES2109_23030 [Nostoc sp. HK-01]|nr:hypothetical protein NIES2109_23030 [Nostoc sp. HK-01]
MARYIRFSGQDENGQEWKYYVEVVLRKYWDQIAGTEPGFEPDPITDEVVVDGDYPDN